MSKSSLEKLEEKIDSGTALNRSRTIFTRRKIDTGENSSWKNEEKKYSFWGSLIPKVIFLCSVVIFLIAGIFSYRLWNSGENRISGDNIIIEVEGPGSVRGGEISTYNVTVKNLNNIELSLVDLKVEYPFGTASPEDPSEELRRTRDSLDTIKSGESKNKSISMIFFGDENSKKTIDLSVEYRVPGSNAVYNKDLSKEILISSSPINMSVEATNEVVVGQDYEYTINIQNNSENVQNSTLVRVDYPFGFSFIEANPKPTFGQNIWSLSDLVKNKNQKIKIKGVFSGQHEEERVIKAAIGAGDGKEDKSILVEYTNVIKSVVLKRPFIDVALNFDSSDQSKDYVASPGERIRGEIVWKNRLDVPIRNIEIKAVVSGNAINKQNISPQAGFFKSVDNTIVWNQKDNNDLVEIKPGAEGRVSFNFVPEILDKNGITIKNPNISFKIYIKGTRGSGDKVGEVVAADTGKGVKVLSTAKLFAKIVHDNGPIINSGNIPPKADKETTYTIVWSITNTSNSLTQAKVKTKLPSYIKFLNNLSPVDADIQYDNITGEVVWNIGNISFKGDASVVKEAAFQVSFTPSQNQIGSTPSVTSEAVFEAVDQYGARVLNSKRSPLSTYLKDELKQNSNNSSVVK